MPTRQAILLVRFQVSQRRWAHGRSDDDALGKVEPAERDACVVEDGAEKSHDDSPDDDAGVAHDEDLALAGSGRMYGL